MTRTLYLVHRWTGIVSGLFVLFFSLTGAVAVYRSEIDRLVSPGLAVERAASRGSLEAALSAARAIAPERAPDVMFLPMRADEAIVVQLAPRADLFRVFVDPSTARVSGMTSGENLANVIRQVHLRFYFFGWQGRVVAGVFGCLLLLSALTGAFIYAPFMKGVWRSGRRWWQRRDGRRQLAWSDWHKLIGISALAFNVLIGFTGAVLGLENLQRFSPALADAIHPNPHGIPPAATCDSPASLDAIVSAAEAAVPQMRAAVVNFPTPRQKYTTVSGNIPGRARMQGASWATLDPCTAAVLERYDEREARVSTRLYLWMDPLHFGDFGGWPLKLLYCLLGATSGALAISGLGVAAMKLPHRRRPRRS